MAKPRPLAEAVRSAREKRGLSLYALAKQARINLWALKCIESGRTQSQKVSISTVISLLEFFGGDIDLNHFVPMTKLTARRKT